MREQLYKMKREQRGFSQPQPTPATPVPEAVMDVQVESEKVDKEEKKEEHVKMEEHPGQDSDSDEEKGG